MEPYRSYNTELTLPVTERLANRLFSLPTGTNVDYQKIEKVCGLIRYSISHAAEIVAKFSERKAEVSKQLIKKR
jgi:hypothetical protein